MEIEVETDRTVDSNQFSAGMRRFAGSCSVIAARSGDARAGLTATAVCSVSAEPARLLVCVNRSVRAHDIISSSGYLSVNVLSENQDDVAKRFAGMVIDIRGEDRFTADSWTEGKRGLPILTDAMVSFGCKVVEEIPGGASHTVFICDVIEVISSGLEVGPLIYFDREFSRLKTIQK